MSNNAMVASNIFLFIFSPPVNIWGNKPFMNLFAESAHLLCNGSKGQVIFRLIIYKVYASLSLVRMVVYNIRKSDILLNIK